MTKRTTQRKSNPSNQSPRERRTRLTELHNAEVQIGPTGHWLLVKTSDGKTAGCCLENLSIGYGAEDVFVQWAEEQKVRHSKEKD